MASISKERIFSHQESFLPFRARFLPIVATQTFPLLAKTLQIGGLSGDGHAPQGRDPLAERGVSAEKARENLTCGERGHDEQ
jgi:hypothetical protein